MTTPNPALGWGALVFGAGSNAPEFLREKIDTVTLGPFG